jgi:hypothetical protein
MQRTRSDLFDGLVTLLEESRSMIQDLHASAVEGNTLTES